MSETQTVLARITALRQHLEQSRGLSQVVAQSCSLLGENGTLPARSVAALEKRVAAEGHHDLLLDNAVRAVVAPTEECQPLPRQLTARARRLLEWSRDLLG